MISTKYFNNTCHCINVRLSNYAKSQWKQFERDTKVYQLKSEKTNQSNIIAAYGFAVTGALGIKYLIKKDHSVLNTKKLHIFRYFDKKKFKIKQVACGYGFTLFAGYISKNQWCLYGTGLNNFSQIGYHNRADYEDEHNQLMYEPRLIEMPGKLNFIKSIASGKSHSVVIAQTEMSGSEYQVVLSFGSNLYGECGRQIIKNEIYRNSQVVSDVNFNHNVKEVTCGENSTYFLTESGHVYSCGQNNMGQLGFVTAESCSAIPQLVGGALKNKFVKQISCSLRTVLVLTSDGEVFGWGDNEHNLIFSNNSDSSIKTPIQLKFPKKIVQVCAGHSTCAVIDEDGHLHTWGVGSIGHGPELDYCLTPKQIPSGIFGTKTQIIDIGIGNLLSAALTNHGTVYLWGNSIGRASSNQIQTFPLLETTPFLVKSVKVGCDHAFFMGKSFV